MMRLKSQEGRKFSPADTGVGAIGSTPCMFCVIEDEYEAGTKNRFFETRRVVSVASFTRRT
jgi:hypothetical protein